LKGDDGSGLASTVHMRLTTESTNR